MSRRSPTQIRQGGATIRFGGFRMDLRGGRLLCEGTIVPMRAKTWAVLEYLVARPGVLVSRDELLDAVWPGVAVTPDTLTKSIGELRVALGDDRRAPQFIETVPRRGFRFIAPTRVETSQPTASGRSMSVAGSVVETDARPFVGRAAELTRLTELFERAGAGHRQTVFVTGPAGIGKTALIEAFLTSAPVRDADPPVSIARGLCVEQYGPREPYLPVLDAIERLARCSDLRRFATVLRHVAPSWLAQIPWLLSPGEMAKLRRSLEDTRAERALREFGAFSEALTRERTLILVLEDLQWSDPSTVDLVSFLALRLEPARLLLLGTVRLEEVEAHGNPVRSAMRALALRKHCVEVPLGDLSAREVATYLRARFPRSDLPAALAPLVHERSGGNPLFLGAVVEELVARGWVAASAEGWRVAAAVERIELGIPQDVQQMIDTQFRSLGPVDRDLIEAASVAGRQFATSVVAAAGAVAADDAEARFDTLARTRRFIGGSRDTELPDGTQTTRFAFTHDVYRQVVYAQIPSARRQRLHQAIGESLEATSGTKALDIASELASHFRLGGDAVRAVRYLAVAAERARQRFASREAAGYLDAAIALVPRLPGEEQRRRRELELRLALAPVLRDLWGFASEELRENCERAHALCAGVGTPEQLFEIIFALSHVHGLRADPVRAPATAAELDELARRLGSAEHRLIADTMLARYAFMHGRYAEACRLAEGVAARRRALTFTGLPTEVVHALIDTSFHHAFALWWLGHAEPARVIMRAAAAGAHTSGLVFTQVAAVCLSGLLALLCRRPDEVREAADRACVLCTEHGFRFYGAMATALRGWVRIQGGAVEEGIQELLRARSALSATGSRIFSTHILAYLAEAYLRAGKFEGGLAVVEEGLAVAEATLERTYWPELWRLKGELLMASALPRLQPRDTQARRASAAARTTRREEAERCLLRALEMARQCEARPLELRAATSLARAWHQGGRDADARAMLAKSCAGFDSDTDFADLAEARMLLQALSSAA